MSRYVTSTHGVIIGWQNCFSFKDQGGVSRSFNAILWVEGYRFEPCNSVNVHVRTPAQQILYTDMGQRDDLRVSQFIRGRCKREGVSFALAPYDVSGSTQERNCPTLFFENVSYARFVRDEIERMLIGVRGQPRKRKSKQ